ncbi:unnamed protein product [Calypogeia fissa]
MLRSKRKRILKEGPINALFEYFFEKDEGKGDETNIYVVEAVEDEVETTIEEMQEMGFCSAYRSNKHQLDGY